MNEKQKQPANQSSGATPPRIYRWAFSAPIIVYFMREGGGGILGAYWLVSALSVAMGVCFLAVDAPTRPLPSALGWGGQGPKP